MRNISLTTDSTTFKGPGGVAKILKDFFLSEASSLSFVGLINVA